MAFEFTQSQIHPLTMRVKGAKKQKMGMNISLYTVNMCILLSLPHM